MNPLEGFALLASGWGQQLTVEQSKVYIETLADVPPEELLAAVRKLVLTDEFRPSIARIRRTVVETRAALPTADEAVDQLDALEAWDRRRSVPIGAGRAAPDRPQVHPTVLAAWKSVGSEAPLGVFQAAWRAAVKTYVEVLVTQPLAASEIAASPRAELAP